ncbi:unnamed protein product [Urochloa humidicola]
MATGNATAAPPLRSSSPQLQPGSQWEVPMLPLSHFQFMVLLILFIRQARFGALPLTRSFSEANGEWRRLFSVRLSQLAGSYEGPIAAESTCNI